MWKTLKSVVRPQGRYKLVTSVMSTLTHTLAYLERYWVDAFDFYRKLADFFRRCGYDRERPL
jgi:hypothetical protein